MNGIGLVFAGGGGKGAYQIGVWKFLREWNLDTYVNGVSGTSVGALNAALFASGDYEDAKTIWETIRKDQILKAKSISISDVSKWIAETGFLSGMKSSLMAGAQFGVTFGMQMTNRMNHSFSFSQEGLSALIESGVNEIAIKTRDIPCFATTLQLPSSQVTRFDLRDYGMAEIKLILLASSALPMIFDPVVFQGNTYYDGGIPFIGDNVPIQPLYDLGLKTIIVVHLSQDGLIDKDNFPDAKIVEIIPQKDLGDTLNGTLDFTSDGAFWRMEQGYQDASRVLKPFIDQVILEYQNEKCLKDALIRQKAFEAAFGQLVERHEQLMEKNQTDEATKLWNKLTGR